MDVKHHVYLLTSHTAPDTKSHIINLIAERSEVQRTYVLFPTPVSSQHEGTKAHIPGAHANGTIVQIFHEFISDRECASVCCILTKCVTNTPS